MNDKCPLYDALLKEARKRTAIADARLDEEGKTIKGKKDEVEELKQDEGVVLVESRAAHLADAENGEPASAGGASSSSDEADIVPLSGKKKPKKRPKRDRDVE